MIASFNNLSSLYDDDIICSFYCLESVSDYDDSSSLE